MSEVKAFTGFLAVDGSTHTSKSAAIAHTRNVKIKSALQSAFGNHSVANDSAPEAPLVALDDFIYTNRDAILASLNQEVLTRKKRSANKAKVSGAKSNKTAQVAPVATI